MNKKIIMKGILLLIVLALLTIGFTGCGSSIIITTTGTVYITVSVPGYYDIFIDGIYQGTTNSYGNLTITSVPTGNYFFEADGYYYGGYYTYYYGYKYQTTYNGITNYVTIPVYFYYY